MSAVPFAVGTGYDSGNVASATSFWTVPAGVTAAMTAIVVLSWSATALETPPTVTLSGQGWTTLVAPRTDGTQGSATYSRTGLVAGDVVSATLSATRFHVVLDLYVRDASTPVAGPVYSRPSSLFTTVAPGVTLAQGTSELDVLVAVERTTVTPTIVTDTGGSVVLGFKEGSGSTISSVYFGTVAASASPSASATITYNTNSSNGIGFQLAVPIAPASSGLHPNSEVVGVAWLKAAVPYLGSRVSTELPTDNSSWSASGFTTVSVVGGSPNIEVGMRKPVFSIDVWGASTNSGKPPWNLASQQAEQIHDAVLAHALVPKVLVLPSGYANARVLQVIPRSEPRRVAGDPASYAHFQFDCEMWWVEQ